MGQPIAKQFPNTMKNSLVNLNLKNLYTKPFKAGNFHGDMKTVLVSSE